MNKMPDIVPRFFVQSTQMIDLLAFTPTTTYVVVNKRVMNFASFLSCYVSHTVVNLFAFSFQVQKKSCTIFKYNNKPK
jgi:hypothetical protein